jgi:hypothetical protein
METSGNPLITSAPRSGGDVLHTPDPRRWWALRSSAAPSSWCSSTARSCSWRCPRSEPTSASRSRAVRRGMVRFKVRADQAATNEQVGQCDHPRAERNQR